MGVPPGVPPGLSPLSLWQRAQLIESEFGPEALVAWEASLTDDERIALLTESDQAMAAMREIATVLAAAVEQTVTAFRRLVEDLQVVLRSFRDT